MLSAVFAVLFGLSLLPGRTPLCLRFARKISGGIVPPGAERYCYRLTWVWFAILTVLALVCLCIDWRLGFATPVAIALTFFVEGRVRRRCFSVAFATSGSTGGAKTIVKTFESLAREVAYHASTLPKPPPGTVFLATVDPWHMYGTLWREMLPKALGCPADPDIILTPEALVAKMRAAEHVFLVTTPSFLDRVTAYADTYDVPRNCVEVTTSGALLTADVAARTKAVFGVAPREIFGSTETGGVAWRRQKLGGEPWQVFAPVRVATSHGRLVVRSPFSFRRRYTMGDAVELAPDARSFRLLGRVDRLVKINEERVDLAEMEARIVRELGFCACAVAVLEAERGPCLGALLVRGDAEGSDFSPLALRRQLLPIFPHGTVPKRIRLVQALPRNAQGKVVRDEVAAILTSDLVEPDVLDARHGADSFEVTCRFAADAPYFRGHFPGAPLLPGVAQVGLAARWAACVLAGDATRRLKCVKKMKFSAVIQPGDTVRVSLRRRNDAETAYEFRKGDEICSSGVLVF